jgi:hypothetical protein
MKRILLGLTVFLCILNGKAQQVYLNEIRANDESTDDGEFIELIGPAGTDVGNWQIEHYNGSGGDLIFSYTIPEGTLIPDDGVTDISGQQIGFLVIKRTDHAVANFDLEWGSTSLQNGPDGILLRNPAGTRIQALTWNGLGDLAGGLPPWREIGSEQNTDNSLSAPDTVFESHAKSWDYVLPTPGLLNTNQATGDISLPVRLSSFQAFGGDSEVRLVWITEAELDNLGFILERAYTQEGDFMQIASYESLDALKGAGNSSEKRKYEFIDPTVFNNITYWYRLIDVSVHGVHTFHPAVSATPVAAINNLDEETSGVVQMPKHFKLEKNYPNPFNPSTMINYQLPMISEVELVVYNQLGQKVAILISGKKETGFHQTEWDASGFPSGLYYYVLHAGSYRDIKKMILLR